LKLRLGGKTEKGFFNFFFENYRDIFGAARRFFLMNTRRKLGLHAQN
jgi:hypothetical protein